MDGELVVDLVIRHCCMRSWFTTTLHELILPEASWEASMQCGHTRWVVEEKKIRFLAFIEVFLNPFSIFYRSISGRNHASLVSPGHTTP